jgi:hypothetical protein
MCTLPPCQTERPDRPIDASDEWSKALKIINRISCP